MANPAAPYYASESRTANMSPRSPSGENNSYGPEFANSPSNGDNMTDHSHVLGGHHYPSNGYMQGNAPYQGHIDDNLAQSAMAAGMGHQLYASMHPHDNMNDRRSSGNITGIDMKPSIAGKADEPPKKATRACDNCRRKKVSLWSRVRNFSDEFWR